MSGDGAVAAALEGLDARSWAPLLRALRRIDASSEPLASALLAPTSALAAGPERRALCVALAADVAAIARLRADASLPSAVHAALGASAPEQDAGPEKDQASSDADGDAVTSSRAAERARSLRRELDEERRRREGAEARADAAEARAAAAAGEASEAAERMRTLEAALADAEESVRQAVARAERRAEGRIAALASELAAARSEAEAQRIDHERTRAELAALRAELAGLRERVVHPSRERAGAVGGRPLALPAGLEPDTTEAARWLAEQAALLLLDGYNIVLTLLPGRPLEEQRRWLVDRVRPLVVRDGARPVVVFDGAGVSGRMRDTGGVEVRFTAGGASADDEIVFMVAATDEPVLVMTDDAELRARVRAEGGDVVGTVHLLGIVGA